MCCGNSILQKGLPFFYLHKIFYTLDTQKSAYKLFNVLNNKLPIVFVGDFENIINNENDYLRKIIDQSG